MKMLFGFLAWCIHTNAVVEQRGKECSLNGQWQGSRCDCDPGWKGDSCSILDLAPADPLAHGCAVQSVPTWGGGAVYTDGRWHLIVGSRAQDWPLPGGGTNDTKTDYVSFAHNAHARAMPMLTLASSQPCDSRIVRAVSKGSDPAGPYEIAEVLHPRSSWEPGLAMGPGGSPLVLMFFGNISAPPPVGSEACAVGSSGKSAIDAYNLTTTNTYITVSESGDLRGPWAPVQLVKGMENFKAQRVGDPYRWACASGNPSPAFHPNGTLFAAMRHNPCWKGFPTREHIGLWRADDGWNGTWTLVSQEPIFGFGGGSERNCTDANLCPSHEDPHLWIDERGFHLLTHNQNNVAIHSTRGAYGWSIDGHDWTLETLPVVGAASVWEMEVRWANGSSSPLARRQRPSLVRNLEGRPTHLISGADFNKHLIWGTCEGCHWGQGFTLIQPLQT